MPDNFFDDSRATLELFKRFQKALLSVKKSSSLEEIIDQMEILLDMVVEALYARVYLIDNEGQFKLERDMALPELECSEAYMRWALENQQTTVIPLDDENLLGGARSAIFMPLTGNVGPVGIVVLWVESDSSEFTQELFGLFDILAHETASCVEAHRLRNRLQESQSRILDVVESVPHGIMAIDANRCIQVINGTLEVMLGVRRDEVLGRQYEKCIPAAAAKTLTMMVKSGSTEESELSLDLTGDETVFGLTLTPMRPTTEGLPTGYVVVCRDLMLSREVHKLREIDAMKNDFLSLVSHELRTPLTSIMAYTETLLMEGMVNDPADRLEYLGIIYNEGERLTRLINDVLDLTKMEAGKMEYVYSECDIRNIISNAITNSMAAAEKMGHKIIEKHAEELPQVRCDSDRIMQVMLNLLSNAIKYTEEGTGIIEVGSKLIESEDHSVPNSVYVWVKDNGIGISPDNLNRVFSRFEQIESMEHHSTGTGLGMPICRMIVEQGHGGHIDVTSDFGKGSKFFFSLPVI